MKTKIYGYSDDLIEVEGAVEEEVAYMDKPIKVSCSDGTSAKITYDGNWIFKILETGTLFDKIIPGNPSEAPHTDEDAKGCSAYSDVLVLKEGVEWVKIGRATIKKAQ